MELLWPSLALLVLVVALFAAEKRFPDKVDRLEENVLATLLAIITIVSFTQVVARYGFNSGWQGALEFTRICFAWLILFGMSYAVKNGINLGVDAFIRMTPRPVFRAIAIFGALCTFLYAFILLYAGWLAWLGADVSTNWRQTGAVGYWTFMFDRGTGLVDLQYPAWMQSAFGFQERVQRWIAYLMLPVGLALLAFRALQGAVAIYRGDRELIIASHEAEELVEQNQGRLEE